MSKFLKLVRNEWRKQTLKKSFWVLLSLVVVIAAGWSVLNVLLTTSAFETETYYGTDFEGFAKEQIAWAEQFVNEVDGDGELTEYALNYRAEADAFRYLVEMDSDFDDWLYTLNVAHEMFYARHCGNEALYQRLRTVCDNRDIKGYYEYYRDIQTDANPQYAAQYREITDWCIQNEVEPSGSDWRYSLAFQALDSAVAVAKQKQLQADGSSAFSEETLKKEENKYAILQYRMENLMEFNPAANLLSEDEVYRTGGSGGAFWTSLAGTTSLLTLVGLICIVIGGSIVSGEFSQGTVKFLLMNPVKRWKILMSKYATTLLMGLLMAVVLLLGAALAALCMGGGGEMLLPMITAKDGVAVLSSPLLELLKQYALAGVKVVVMTTLAFALSSLLRSSAVATGVSLFAFLSGSLLVTLLQGFGFDWARYLLFANMDFNAVLRGTTGFPNHSPLTAVVVVILHMVVFILTAWDGFVRREV